VVDRGAGKRLVVLGPCGAQDAELHAFARGRLPEDIAWCRPGAYLVVEESADRIVLHTDPAAARPVYLTRHNGCWVWCTSARTLAGLAHAQVDVQRLACAVFLPSVPALAGQRTYFDGVSQLPSGSRIELLANCGHMRVTEVWRPDPEPGRVPHARLRAALRGSVRLRTGADPGLSCDLSGGLDSTSITAFAAAALPSTARLHTVTVHPEGDTSGADVTYARLAAHALGDRAVHHLLPLGPEHLPYSDITAVSATDEPAPSTLVRSRLDHQFRWMKGHLGTRTHLTGDGGDSVLFQPPIHLADLLRRGRWGRALGEAFGWARLRKEPVMPLLYDAVRVSAVTRDRALAALPRALGRRTPDHHGRVRWFCLLPTPDWAPPAARRLLGVAAEEAAAAPPRFAGLDASVRVLVDEIREVARTAVADQQLADVHRVDLHNPFLDPAVVDAVLRTPLDQRPRLHCYKPLLREAMVDLLPPEIAARTTKGSFDADHFAGVRANLPDLLRLADGWMAAYGLLDPAAFRRAIRRAGAGLPMPLAALEQALAAEAWLTAHDRAALPEWEIPAAAEGR
jgi:asparagine synthase (glutamine-hydrolysing)